MIHTTPLVSLRDLRVSFDIAKREIQAVQGVSLELHKGDILALVGESGSGKTMTALSIPRLLPGSARCSGQILFDGEDVNTASQERLSCLRGARIGVVFQEPMTSLNPLHTVRKQIAETLMIHSSCKRTEVTRRVVEWLGMVGIESPHHYLEAYPHQLSGGQRQRVMIAMALVNSPDLLIADEPTTALDVTVQARILDLIMGLQKRLGMAVLFVTHDLNLAWRVANQVAVMCEGKIVEAGPVESVLKAPKHDYTRMLVEAEPSGAPASMSLDAAHVLRVSHLRTWFPIRRGLLRRTKDYIKAVDGIDLTLHAGETVGLVGESGSGKTTLAMALLRLEQSQGSICFLNQDIDGLNWRDMRPLRRHMQVVFQDPHSSLSPRMTVAHIIDEGLRIHESFSPAEREEKVIRAMQDVGLDPEARVRYPHELSGGQRQRVAIARALVLDPRLLILDEPTSALDRVVQKQILDLLRGLQKRYSLAYLFISHDLAVIRSVAHRIMVMKAGRIVEEGPTKRLMTSPREAYTKALMSAAFLRLPSA